MERKIQIQDSSFCLLWSGFESDAAFADCSSLKNVVIPSSMTSIGEKVFCHCRSLQHVRIPSNVCSIHKHAFIESTTMTSIEVSKDNQPFVSVDGVLFRKDMSSLLKFPARKSVEDGTIDIPNRSPQFGTMPS